MLYWMAVIADPPTDELDQQEQSVIKRSPALGGRGVKVSFILPRDGGRVSVVGDFNDWDPFAHPLRPRSNGTRSVAVTLPPGGRYAFRYLSEGGRWHDDAAADAFEPNGAGGYNSILET
jgi:Carbohydrate-binding module 48 (Isoamylase N-terminal domain)